MKKRTGPVNEYFIVFDGQCSYFFFWKWGGFIQFHFKSWVQWERTRLERNYSIWCKEDVEYGLMKMIILINWGSTRTLYDSVSQEINSRSCCCPIIKIFVKCSAYQIIKWHLSRHHNDAIYSWCNICMIVLFRPITYPFVCCGCHHLLFIVYL